MTPTQQADRELRATADVIVRDTLARSFGLTDAQLSEVLHG